MKDTTKVKKKAPNCFVLEYFICILVHILHSIHLYALRDFFIILFCFLTKQSSANLITFFPPWNVKMYFYRVFSLIFLSVPQRYGQLYDLSRSERSKIQELAVTMATDGQPLDRIGELLRVAVGPLDLSVKIVLQDAVEKVVAALRYSFSL